MIPNPIHKALSIVKSSNARFLVMGGQACVLYGAADFSRDLDLAVGIQPGDVQSIMDALTALKAERIFFPPLDAQSLARGHACHFRCFASGVEELRIDLMTTMRGCDPFDLLWERRTILDIAGIGEIGVLSLPDLIRAKKTQRDKDWPMIQRLVEVDYLRYRQQPSPKQIRFWLLECRTPEMLIELARRYRQKCSKLTPQRPLLECAKAQDAGLLIVFLQEEEALEREADCIYWAPLRAELEMWRRERLQRKQAEMKNEKCKMRNVK